MKNNNFKKYISGLLLLFSSVAIYAHSFTGVVYAEGDEGKESIEGAYVYFPKSAKGMLSLHDGTFLLQHHENDGNILVASHVGFNSDTILITGHTNTTRLEFYLRKDIQLSETVVAGYQQGTYSSMITPFKTETITKAGLMKLACCNLSESFENSATVTVGFTDAVSGAKQVQLLGLSSIYSQMMAENIPTMRGLASTYGWSYMPGSWLESIHISKGASSVVNGYESLTGQINLEMKKPDQTDPLFLNFYADHAGRYEGNLTAAAQVSKELWTGLFLHASTESQEHDYNGDGFMDQPRTKFVNLYNRWSYLAENGLQSRTGIKFLYDQRYGGQTSAHSEHQSMPLYSSDINNRNFTVENKTGFPVGTKEGQTIGIITSLTRHEQSSVLGYKTYEGSQNTFYTNFLFSSSIDADRKHKYTVGASFLYDDFDTRFSDLLPFNNIPETPINRTELVPGMFGEYTYSLSEKLILIAGVRGDYNSRYGWLFTPRSNLKYNLSENIVFRASAGRGFRAPNVIAENIGLMASSRKFNLDNINNLDIERAWNYGGNIAFSIPIWDNRSMSLSLDYFHTEFDNQAVIDVDRSPNDVFFYNLANRSFADVLQADLSFTAFKGFDVYTAFRYNNNRIDYQDGGNVYRLEKPLVSKYRGLLNLSYATNLKRWVFDVTAQVNGPARIPSLNGYPSEAEYSPVFPIYFAQVTKNSKRFDVYLGVENIMDYRQNNPIINADNPFGSDFDSSLIWGPLMGRKIYIGTRIRIGDLK